MTPVTTYKAAFQLQGFPVFASPCPCCAWKTWWFCLGQYQKMFLYPSHQWVGHRKHGRSHESTGESVCLPPDNSDNTKTLEGQELKSACRSQYFFHAYLHVRVRSQENSSYDACKVSQIEDVVGFRRGREETVDSIFVDRHSGLDKNPTQPTTHSTTAHAFRHKNLLWVFYKNSNVLDTLPAEKVFKSFAEVPVSDGAEDLCQSLVIKAIYWYDAQMTSKTAWDLRQ